MRRPAHKTLVLAVGVVIGIMLIIGCEEKQSLSDMPPNVKRSRLIAVRNAELKVDIKKLKREHEKELKRQKQLLDKCLQQKKNLEELSSEGVQSYMEDVLGPVAEENTKLSKENEALKAQIKRLQSEKYNLLTQIQKLRKELEKVKKQTGSPPAAIEDAGS